MPHADQRDPRQRGAFGPDARVWDYAHLVARMTRYALAALAAMIVLWSFARVGERFLPNLHAKAHRITLTVLHWGDPDETSIVKTLLARYEQRHPDVRIRRIHANDYGTKLRTMFSSGSPPDLFYLSYANVPQMARLHLLLKLDPYLAQARRQKKGRFLNDFFPLLLNAFRYNGHRAGAGPLYGLPKDFTTMVMYINKNLFKRAGVPVPYAGWTWKQFETDTAKIRRLPPSATGRIYGSVLETWPGVLRNIFWTFGGRFIGPDGRHTLFGDAADQAAMRMIRNTRLVAKSSYSPSGLAKSPGEAFFTGNVGCIGPLGRWMTPRYRSIRGFDWDVVPLPHAAGVAPVSTIATVAWCIAKSTPHPRHAFNLMEYLCGPRGQAVAARLGLAIPSLRTVADSPAFLNGAKPAHTALFLSAIKTARLARYPPDRGQFNQIINTQISKSLQQGAENPARAAAVIRSQWNQYLRMPLQTRHYPAMPWGRFVIVGGIITLIFAAPWIAWVVKRRRAAGGRGDMSGWIFISPWVIGFLAFTLGPMIVSLLLSFTKWSALQPLSGARYVGFANYRQIFTHDRLFRSSLAVTFYYALLAVPISQVAALLVALLMNLRIKGIALFRTIYFVPSVVSGVALATLWLLIFNNSYGLMNAMLRPLTHLFGARPPNWFGTDAARWAVPAFVIMGLWGVGAGMVIYLAGLKNVPASLYEAATLDGAGPVRRFFAVTVPMLSPLLFYNLIMSIIGSFQVFTQAKVMTNGGPDNATLFYVLYLYNQAFESHNMGYASALAWILFIVVLLLTLVVFRVSKKYVYYEGLKA